MTDKDRVENAEYWAEVRCHKDVCEYRIRRREYNREDTPETVAYEKGIPGRKLAQEQATKARDKVRFENGWVRVHDYEQPF